MNFPLHQWERIDWQTLVPGFKARFIHSPGMTFAFVEAERDAIVPEHYHPHEQVTHVLDGTLELTINGVPRHMKSGDVAVIHSNIPHAARAITDCRLLDVFTPQREDYTQGNFSVVQKKAG